MDLFADAVLAACIESLTATCQRGYAEAHAHAFPALGASWAAVAGGVATYLELGSSANGTFGVGMSGPVSAEEFDALDRFFRDRDARPVLSVCPLADSSLVHHLEARGYAACGFENVLARELCESDRFDAAEIGVDVVVAGTAHAREEWASVVSAGFAAPDEPTATELRLGRSAAAKPDSQLFMAYVDGRPAGVGELFIDGDVALLTADTTLPAFRRRGVQSSLQRARLEAARDAGCILAATESLPGSVSQRNMERVGFHIVYTRVEALGPALADERN